MSILKTFLQKNKGLALLTFVMICLQIAGTLGVPKLVAKLIDTGIASGEASVIKKIGVEMLLVAFLGTIAAVASSYFQHWLPLGLDSKRGRNISVNSNSCQ